MRLVKAENPAEEDDLEFGRHVDPATWKLLTCIAPKPIGTTPNHPIWSVDREAFVRADSLTVSERLQTLNGIARITSISPRGPPEPVYNLEVQVKHTYFVADTGVLVHNGAPCNASDLPVNNLDDFATKNKVVKNLKNATDSFNIRVKNQKQAEELLESARKRIYGNPKITYGGNSGKVGFEVHGVNSSEIRVGNDLPHLKFWDWLDGKKLGLDGHIFFDGLP